MKQGLKSLTGLETQFFALMQSRKQEVLFTGDVKKDLSITKTQENLLLSKLSKKKMILRLLKGTYLIPSKIPLGGSWTPNELIVISKLMKIIEARYQLCGYITFNKYGLTKQIPQRISIYNDKISCKKTIGSYSMDFIKVPKKRLGGFENTILYNKDKINIPTLARTLMDAFYDWSRFGFFEEALISLNSKESKENNLDKDLIECVMKYGNVGTKRRIGYILESRSKSTLKNKGKSKYLRKLKSSLKETSSWIALNPLKAMRGKVNRKWGLIIN